MKELNVAILDDEQLAIDTLAWELKRCDYKINIVATYTNPVNAIQNLKNHKIDILFLDIQMPQMTGFEFIEIYNQINFSIVFVTAYDNFALKAFKYSALDYILKPVDAEQLNTLFEKWQDFTPVFIYKEQAKIHQSFAKSELPEKVVFSTQETLEFVNPKDIMYCLASGNYTQVILKDKKLLLSKTLKEIEQMLEVYSFIRIHQSHLINPKHILRYIKNAGGSIVMADGKELSISRSKKDDFFTSFIEKLIS